MMSNDKISVKFQSKPKKVWTQEEFYAIIIKDF